MFKLHRQFGLQKKVNGLHSARLLKSLLSLLTARKFISKAITWPVEAPLRVIKATPSPLNRIARAYYRTTGALLEICKSASRSSLAAGGLIGIINSCVLRIGCVTSTQHSVPRAHTRKTNTNESRAVLTRLMISAKARGGTV